ncbi:hypothetical protein EP331_00440 [bacterium]|nr:MAG: hypothetical protein EP331_00440 [bacterium]
MATIDLDKKNKECGFIVERSPSFLRAGYLFSDSIIEELKYWNNNNMKEMKITPPKGYEVDKDKSTFENIVFKKKDSRPMSWEEYVDHYLVCGSEHSFSLSLLTGFIPKKYIALRKLELLRNAWNDGVKFNWRTLYYWCICQRDSDNKEVALWESHSPRFLHFKDRETAFLFFETFKDLIEEAKDLI